MRKSTHGVWCYAKCGAEIEGKNERDVEQKMHDANWVIGLDATGQAWYSCPDCSPALFACTRVIPLNIPLATQASGNAKGGE